MPIYEYLCQECGTRFEKLIRGTTGADSTPTCPSCESAATQRVLSSFAHHGGTAIDREAAQAERQQSERLASITPKAQIDKWRSARKQTK